MPLTAIEIASSSKNEMIDITKRVKSVLRAEGVDFGVVYVFCPHTTAGITIQENTDPNVRTDMLLALDNAIPNVAPRGAYLHSEGNSDAHVKASLVGASQMIPVEGGKLQLGTWQAIYLCEFDGPRNRRVLVKSVAG